MKKFLLMNKNESMKGMQWMSTNIKLVLSCVGVTLVVLFYFAYAQLVLAMIQICDTPDCEPDGGGYSIGTITIPEIIDAESTTATYPSNAGAAVAGAYSQTIQVAETLWYPWNRWLSSTFPTSDTQTQGWVTGLGQPNITIGYDVYITDTSGNIIPEGSNVSVNSTIKLKFAKYVYNNIYWFGTGYSMDSPYGDWSTNATPPPRVSNRVTCESKDYTVKYTGTSAAFDIYIPFMVNPSLRTILPSSLTGLNCGSGVLTTETNGTLTLTCTVTGTGTLSPTFRFDSTYGKFYYRYYDSRTTGGAANQQPGCYGNNIPMARNPSNPTPSGPARNSDTTIYSPYIVTIPTKDITINLNAGAVGNPPTAPTLTCPATAAQNSNITITLRSTDPESNTIRYGVDWDTATPAPYQVTAWSGYVASGVNTSLTKSGGFSTPGAYVIYAMAQDSTGASSAWSSCTVNVVANSSPVANAGSDRTVNLLTTNSVTLNTPVVPTATDLDGTIVSTAWTLGMTNPAGLTGGTITNGTTLTPTFSNLVAGTYNFRLTATDDKGSTGYDVMTVTVTNGTTGIQAVTGTCGGRIDLSWDEDVNFSGIPATYYEVSKDGGAWVNIGEGLAWTDTTGLIPGSSHTYSVHGKRPSALGFFTAQGPVTGVASASCAPNTAPIANAGPDRSITLPQTTSVLISGASASDPGGSVASTVWSKISGPSGSSISNGTTLTPSFNSLSVGVYEFRLTVTDNLGLTHTDNMYVNVWPATQCNDGIDNDGDGSIDYPIDTGCSNSGDNDETNIPPTLTASPIIVNQGSATTITWDTNNGDESLCTIQGGTYAVPTNLSTLPANGDGETGSFTPTINANTTYTLTCPSGIATVTVEIIPTGFET